MKWLGWLRGPPGPEGRPGRDVSHAKIQQQDEEIRRIRSMVVEVAATVYRLAVDDAVAQRDLRNSIDRILPPPEDAP